MKKYKIFSAINIIIFVVIFVLIFIESIFNIFEMWEIWNFFGYILALLLLPALNIISLIFAIISVCGHKNTNGNNAEKHSYFLPMLFFILGLIFTIIAYMFVFTWGFGILHFLWAKFCF